jgi:ABC-type bacteriocin/lantibiotic exporter with double-glycine peptidase domain
LWPPIRYRRRASATTTGNGDLGATRIVVAHRVSAVRDVARSVGMKDSSSYKRVRFEELAARNSFFVGPNN